MKAPERRRRFYRLRAYAALQQSPPQLAIIGIGVADVGRALKPGAIVCYESTVYPGLTEDYCGPILARTSDLAQGRDFKLGYSPERINLGDKEHTPPACRRKLLEPVAA